MAFSVAPGLLVAMPSLLDPNFFRSVVLMCAHSEEGAFGLVINQRLEIPVAAICAEAEVTWEGGEGPVVFNGGPVERQRGWLIHSDEVAFEGSQPVAEGVALTTSHDALEAYGRDPDGPFRLMLGYAGWGRGQLDAEIHAGAWLTAPASRQLVFTTPIAQLWTETMKSLGVDPSRLVESGTQLN
jgi:putative transcriptional regulator